MFIRFGEFAKKTGNSQFDVKIEGQNINNLANFDGHIYLWSTCNSIAKNQKGSIYADKG